jgi:iron complex outermembrane receptor protein
VSSAAAQQVDTLPPVIVSVTRADLPLARVPFAVAVVDKSDIGPGRATRGLDEALAGVPGVLVANRYNFSLDQRISIRGFGARSAFAVRGVKVLLDGIPQTLPDGQGQLTNLELGAVDRIEVLRGPASALYGNAAGGVISIWTDRPLPERQVTGEVRVVAGSFDRALARTWTKVQVTPRFRVGSGALTLTLSRLRYAGERDHSEADLRNYNARLDLPLASVWSLSALLDVGDDPRADNPGALTVGELQADRNAAAAANLRHDAGKDVTQRQSGVTLRRRFTDGGEAVLTVFGFARDLKNPITTAYIDLGRIAYGSRVTLSRPAHLGRLRHQLTGGFDFQLQRDDRQEFQYMPDSVTPDTVHRKNQLERVAEVGPFVQSALELSPRATLTAGLRYDWVRFRVRDRLIDTIPPADDPDDSGRRLMRAASGSVGLALTPAAGWTLFGNLASSFETPTTTELANRPDTAGGFNSGLRPQHAWNFEVGARHMLRGGAVSVSLFQANVRDELIPYELAAPRSYYRNAGRSRHRGMELGVNVSVLPTLDLLGAWTYSHFTYQDYSFTAGTRTYVLDGRDLPGVPQQWLRVLLRARPPLVPGGWAEVETLHGSGYPVDDTTAVRTAPWWVTSLRLGWEGSAGGMRLAPFIALDNAFNRKYVGSVVINAARGRYYEPAPGRNAYLGLRIGAGK